jgi:hypothetical protein
MKILTRVVLVLALALIALLMTGCGHDQPQRKPLDDVVLTPKTDKVVVPEKTLQPCKKLPRMEDRAYKEKEALAYMNDLLAPVAECRDTKQDLINTAKKAFNSK